MPWQAINGIATGAKHLELGQPCQDWGVCEIISEGSVIIGAVSDGMGSAKHSEIGSKLAVEIAISEIRSWDWQFSLTNEQDARNFFRRILSVVKAALNKKANTSGYPVEDLACTLLVFIATSKWVAAMQVGDGLIVVRAEGEDYQLLFKPDKGEFANETTSITSSNALQEMQVCLLLINCQFICAATDGIENISLIKPENWKPSETFFQPLEQHMLSTDSLELKKQELDKFLNSEKINQSTHDDKTLILCIYQELLISEKSLYKPTSVSSTETFYSNCSDIQQSSKYNISIGREIKKAKADRYQQLIHQDVKILSYKIRNVLNNHGYQHVNFKFGISTGSLDILLESDQPIKCRKALVTVICSAILNLKYLVPKKMRIINFIRGTSRNFWQEKFKR